jgi:hypothetical protein
VICRSKREEPFCFHQLPVIPPQKGQTFRRPDIMCLQPARRYYCKMAYILGSEMGDTQLSIEIVSYEFPDNPANELDANWVVIVVSGRVSWGAWQATKAALLTWEIEDLIQWCRGNYCTEPLTQFIEPALQFFAIDIDTRRLHLQVTLSRELLPPWHRDAPLVLDLVVSGQELLDFADDLEEQLAKFPYRHPAHKS